MLKKYIDKQDQMLCNEDILFDFCTEETEPIVVSVRHKRRMNRIFRRVSLKGTIPFPEADNFFERLVSLATFLLIKCRIIDN